MVRWRGGGVVGVVGVAGTAEWSERRNGGNGGGWLRVGAVAGWRACTPQLTEQRCRYHAQGEPSAHAAVPAYVFGTVHVYPDPMLKDAICRDNPPDRAEHANFSSRFHTT